jgi:hypothetical protein
MTLPVERKHAVLNAEQFLRDLMDPKATPRVPLAVRQRAWRCLKHFPNQYDMEIASEQAPTVFGEQNTEYFK